MIEALGPQEAGDLQATLSQNCCCFKSTGLASVLPPSLLWGSCLTCMTQATSCENRPLELSLQRPSHSFLLG